MGLREIGHWCVNCVVRDSVNLRRGFLNTVINIRALRKAEISDRMINKFSRKTYTILRFVSVITSNVTYYSRSSAGTSAVTIWPVSFKLEVLGLNKFWSSNFYLDCMVWRTTLLYTNMSCTFYKSPLKSRKHNAILLRHVNLCFTYIYQCSPHNNCQFLLILWAERRQIGA